MKPLFFFLALLPASTVAFDNGYGGGDCETPECQRSGGTNSGGSTNSGQPQGSHPKGEVICEAFDAKGMVQQSLEPCKAHCGNLNETSISCDANGQPEVDPGPGGGRESFIQYCLPSLGEVDWCICSANNPLEVHADFVILDTSSVSLRCLQMQPSRHGPREGHCR